MRLLLSLLIVTVVPRAAQQELNVSAISSVKDFGAAGNGTTDDLPAIKKAFAAVAGKGQRLLFPAGTYAVSGTVVIPNKTQIYGVGRGDAGGVNTVIKALPGFPPGAAVIEMGPAPGPNFGIEVENLTIDGASIAGTCLANHYAQELSFGRNLLLINCGARGLVVSNVGQNSGPFENLEIDEGAGPTVNTNTVCVEVTSVGAFRGIHGLTCNGGSHYASRPAVALALDGTGIYQDIHVEHFGTAVTLGNRANSADGLIFADGSFGPDVTTGLAIASASHVNNQNLTILGISCTGCTTLLSDGMTGTKISDTSVGWYLLGNGGSNKAIWSSNYGIGGQVTGPFRAPEMQLTALGSKPPCSASTRGTFWFVRSPPGSPRPSSGLQQIGSRHILLDHRLLTFRSNAGAIW